MRTSGLFLLILFSGLSLRAQKEQFWIFFQDKGPAMQEQLAHPERLLSALALEKRAQRGIPTDELDVPVHSAYLKSLEGEGCSVLGTSRWLNAAFVESEKSPESLKEKYSFIRNFSRRKNQLRPSALPAGGASQNPSELNAPEFFHSADFGQAKSQADMMNVPALHRIGFTGSGVVVAIMDAGFAGADTNPAFSHLWRRDRVLGWYDFSEKEKDVFEDDDHGLHVLSCIGAWMPGEIIGTGPGASFLLGRTEVTSSESRQEELNWLMGMEWADSMGADVLHSSLGYSTFDEDKEDYKYDSLDGNTALITRAAKIAVSRGLLVTTSAGNEGFSSWHYITAPCDCEGVLCIGSVDREGKLSYFSSVGPTFDGRIKPDVVAMGSRTAVVSSTGKVVRSDGTSYSAPLVAGMAACLVQAHPSRKGSEIVDAIRRSGNAFQHHNNKLGYGIPDAVKADSILTEMDKVALAQSSDPDPAKHFRIERISLGGETRLINVSGKYLPQKARILSVNDKVVAEFDLKGEKENIIPCSFKDGLKVSTLEIQLQGGQHFRVNLKNYL